MAGTGGRAKRHLVEKWITAVMGALAVGSAFGTTAGLTQPEVSRQVLATQARSRKPGSKDSELPLLDKNTGGPEPKLNLGAGSRGMRDYRELIERAFKDKTEIIAPLDALLGPEARELGAVDEVFAELLDKPNFQRLANDRGYVASLRAALANSAEGRRLGKTIEDLETAWWEELGWMDVRAALRAGLVGDIANPQAYRIDKDKFLAAVGEAKPDGAARRTRD